MSKYNDEYRPSGAVLPLVLRKKLQETQLSSKEPDEAGSSGNVPVKISFSLEPPSSALANSVFTATELEERMLRTTAAMIDIQKQLTRGEESYFEDTNAHGNLYRGWDMFIDAKDSAGAPSSGGTGGSRRMHSDHRWFSGSCRSVTTRGVRQASFYSSKSSTVSSAAQSRNTTPVPVEQKANAWPPPPQQQQQQQKQQQQQLQRQQPQVSAVMPTVDTRKLPIEAATTNEALDKESTTENKDEKTSNDSKKPPATPKTACKDEKKTSYTTTTMAKAQPKAKIKAEDSEGEKVEKSSSNKEKSKAGKTLDMSPAPSHKRADKSESASKSTNAKKREAPTTPKADTNTSDNPHPPIRLSTRKKQKSDTLNFSKFP